jgi:hypothetical protein
MSNSRVLRYLPVLTTVSALVVAAAFAIAAAGCGKSAPPKPQYDMGERVKVGGLTYNVIESEWKSQLGEFPQIHTPTRNFLLIRVSITNSSGVIRTMPSLTVENSNGDSFTEEASGLGVPNWLGLLRRLPPAQTEEGWVLFDVPTNSYRLRLSDTTDAGEEIVTHVAIPLKLEQQQGTPSMQPEIQR